MLGSKCVRIQATLNVNSGYWLVLVLRHIFGVGIGVQRQGLALLIEPK
jgi:hypothetical protein